MPELLRQIRPCESAMPACRLHMPTLHRVIAAGVLGKISSWQRLRAEPSRGAAPTRERPRIPDQASLNVTGYGSVLPWPLTRDTASFPRWEMKLMSPNFGDVILRLRFGGRRATPVFQGPA